MATEKLYLNDSLKLDFHASVVGPDQFEGHPSLVLEATAFYPRSGGQLGDRGRLGDLEVVDTRIADDGTIHHLLEQAAPAELAGQELAGEIDFARRRDMMSQHTGQHILSAAVYRLTGLETVSARLGAEISTLDLARPGPFPSETLEQIEDLVNQTVMENRPITVLYPEPEELARLPLRKQPSVSVGIRLLQVDDFDLTPCGGTHCSRSGEVGPLAIIGQERHKGGIRLSFLFGRRTLDYHRQHRQVIASMCTNFSCGAADLPRAMEKTRENLERANYELARLRAEWANLEAGHLLRQHPEGEGKTLISVFREAEDQSTMRKLAGALAARADVLAAVAWADGDGIRLILEAGADTGFHCGNWFRQNAADLGGRGGGKANRAEGRFPKLDRRQLQDLLAIQHI